MIRHEYKGHGGPPLPPQLSADSTRPWAPSSAPSPFAPGLHDTSCLPLVPASRTGCHSSDDSLQPSRHTQYPYVTGSAVVAFKYRDGVLMAADTMGAWGKGKRYKSVQRMHQVSPHAALGASGEISDYQYILTLLDELLTEDFTEDDGHVLRPKELFNYLSRVMYNRRNKFDPLWNTVVLAGYHPKENKPFLGTVSMKGTQVENDEVATGYGVYLALPLLRQVDHLSMGEEEALKLLAKVMEVLLARDSAVISKIQVTNVTAKGVSISEPFAVAANFDLKFYDNPRQDPYSGSW